MSRKQCIPSTAALVTATAVAALALSSTALGDPGGGNDGSPFTLTCPDNMVLVGVRGKESNLIDKIQGICSRFDADGQRIDNLAYTGAVGTGANNFLIECPLDMAVTKLSGQSGSYIDTLRLECHNLVDHGDRARAGEDSRNTRKVGGEGIGFLDPVNYNIGCTEDKFARVIRGRSGDSINRLQSLDCMHPNVVAVTFDVDFDIDEGNTPQVIPAYIDLDGYTLQPEVFSVRANWMPGSIATDPNPITLTVPEGQRGLDFGYRMPAGNAGCLKISAITSRLEPRTDPRLFVRSLPVNSASGSLAGPPLSPAFHIALAGPNEYTTEYGLARQFARSIVTSSNPDVMTVVGVVNGKLKVIIKRVGCVVLTFTVGTNVVRYAIEVEHLPG
jgi:hypothetical protein